MIFSGQTTLSQLMRARPLSVQILDGLTGGRYLNYADDKISDFCAKEDLPEPDLLEKLSRLRPVSAGMDWNKKPLYHLIDHLTEGHHEFRAKDLPAIRALFARRPFPADLDGYLFRLIYEKFCAFEEELLWHMGEEERFLFPKILRTEACWLHPDLVPEIHIGLTKLLAPVMIDSPEEKLKQMISIILDNIHNQVSLDPIATPGSEIHSLVQSLKNRLVAHANLESDVLYPRAIRMEKDLAARTSKRPGRSAE